MPRRRRRRGWWLRGHGAAGEGYLAGSRWHRCGGRCARCLPSRWPPRSECRSQGKQGRRNGDTARATRVLHGSGAGDRGEGCPSGHCSANEHYRSGGPPTLHQGGQSHGPLSRAGRWHAWQLCTAHALEVCGSRGEEIEQHAPTRRMATELPCAGYRLVHPRRPDDAAR
jgi:hypothetical protein